MSAIPKTRRPTLPACCWCREPFVQGQLAVVVRAFGKTATQSWYYEACGESCAEIIETLMRVNRRSL